LTQEAIHGIKVIKLYAWEESLFRAVEKIRSKEIKSVRGILVLRAIISGFLQVGLSNHIHSCNDISTKRSFHIYASISESLI
jgi:hypothetical protein